MSLAEVFQLCYEDSAPTIVFQQLWTFCRQDLISVLPAFPAHRCMELLPIFALAGYQPENIERFTADVCQVSLVLVGV